jgi:hypothetical protein
MHMTRNQREKRPYITPGLITYGTVEDLTGTWGEWCIGENHSENGKGFGTPNDGDWRIGDFIGSCS